MKPFNLEAAKHGEPFEFNSTMEGWRNASFVGVRKNGTIVGEFESVDVPGKWVGFEVSPTGFARSLRMAPKKRTVYVNLYDQVNPFSKQLGKFAVWHDTEQAAHSASAKDAVATAVHVEIDE